MRTRLSILAMVLGLIGAPVYAAEGDGKEAPKVEMMTYYMGMIKKGPSWTPDATPEVMRIQEGHMANIRSMAEAGKLVLAGPFLNDGNLRGIFLFKTETAEEAQALVAIDPAVKAGRLVVELIPWFGPAGIQVVQPPAPPASQPASAPVQDGANPLPTNR